MIFLDPKTLKKFYEKIIAKYDDEYGTFFRYFKKNWINKKKLGKYTSIFNYFENIKGNDFDTKYVFLTNNISEILINF